MPKIDKPSWLLSRRALLAGGPAAALSPLLGGAASAAVRCDVRKDDWDWSVELDPLFDGDPAGADIAKLEVTHSFFYGSPYGASAGTLIMEPELGFSISLYVAAGKIIEGTVQVSPLAYGSRSYAGFTSGEPAIQYWPRLDQQDHGIRVHEEHRAGMGVYFLLTAANGQAVRLEGKISRGRRSPIPGMNSGLSDSEDPVEVKFTLQGETVANQLVHFLRKQMPVTAETGILFPDGRRAAVFRQTLAGEGPDRIYREALAELNGKLQAVWECEAVDNPCFLTTACCLAFGRPDDCFELQTLRRFRDGWLLRQPFGPDVVSHYYAVSPPILSRLAASPEGKRKLRVLYWTRILPCVALIRIGAYRRAYALYREMTGRLEREFLSGRL